MPENLAGLLDGVLVLHDLIFEAIVGVAAGRQVGALAAVVRDEDGDTVFQVDKVAEDVLLKGLEPLARRAPLRVLAEGLPREGIVLPAGTAVRDVKWRVLIDPVDGSRSYMYQKRSAWILSAVAPERGPATRLSDAVVCVQSELPLQKQHLWDRFCWTRENGVTARRFDRVRGVEAPIQPEPSTARSLEQGFAGIARFFPGGRDLLGAIDDALMERIFGVTNPAKPRCFEDQYLSTAGQFHELMTGRDRFIADLRPWLMTKRPAQQGMLCARPYDVCTLPIARALGVVITDLDGHPLDAPMNIDADVGWIGYANTDLRALIERHLEALLKSA